MNTRLVTTSLLACCRQIHVIDDRIFSRLIVHVCLNTLVTSPQHALFNCMRHNYSHPPHKNMMQQSVSVYDSISQIVFSIIEATVVSPALQLSIDDRCIGYCTCSSMLPSFSSVAASNSPLFHRTAALIAAFGLLWSILT